MVSKSRNEDGFTVVKRTTERKNPMVAASKKEMNDTVIQLRDKDGHNSMVRSSVSLSL